jgi:hypothetical protein
VCGKDADGGNAQSGCGKTYGWGSVPKLSVQDLPPSSSEKERGGDADINSTDLHFNTHTLHREQRKVALKCHCCSKDVYGARFECLTCPVDKRKQRSESALCLPCVLQVIKFSASAASEDDDGPFTHAGCAAARESSRRGPGAHTCQACGGGYVGCHGSYGYRSRNGHWSAGECRETTDQPESPNEDYCSQLCEEHGGGGGGGAGVGVKVKAHRHHLFDILPPPSTSSAASLVLVEVSSSSGEVAAYNLPAAIGRGDESSTETETETQTTANSSSREGVREPPVAKKEEVLLVCE